VIVSFVGIGGIVGDHCLNCPFIITFNEMIVEGGCNTLHNTDVYYAALQIFFGNQ
jgi:hypothetical protein